jgi:hypothetical protein
LGVVTVLSQDEVNRVFASLDSKAIAEERGKLASLMTHRVASLARLIPKESDPQKRLLLHLFLARRIEAPASILAGWGSPLDEVRRDEVAVSKKAVEDVLVELRPLAEHAAQDRVLMQRLAWGNGVLSSLSEAGAAFYLDLSHWPSDLQLTTRSGAEFFIFEEFLVNALKYGKPGSTPVLMARVVRDVDRRWVEVVDELVRFSNHRGNRGFQIAQEIERNGVGHLFQTCPRLRNEFAALARQCADVFGRRR